jgi:membrane fusion protein, multidrug efflux system
MKKILIFICLLFLIVSCGTQDKKAQLEKLKKEHDKISQQIAILEKELNPAGTESAVMVNAEPVKRAAFQHYIEVQGRIDGNENIGVSPRSPGVVTKILVTEGDYVKKGQILAELDADVLKRNMIDLETQLAYVTDLYNRQKSLWDQGIGSEKQYLDAKNGKESLENKVSAMKEQIKMSNITSPIDGTIEDIPIKVGQMAAVGVPSFRVINFSKAKAVADVGEAYSSKISTGDQVKVYLPDFNEEIVQKVTFASKFINPTNRTFTVEVELPQISNNFRANMIAVIRIKDYSNPSAIAVPQNYIQSSKNEGLFIFVAREENGKKVVRKAYIKPGITYNGLTEIVSGLKEGDMVITAGYKDLYDGQVVSYK